MIADSGNLHINRAYPKISGTFELLFSSFLNKNICFGYSFEGS